MQIRPVDPKDIPALSALAGQTFSETFAHLYPPEDLRAFLETSYAPDVLAPQVADSDQFWRIVWDAGEAVAYLQACPVGLPHADADPRLQGEIKRLYVLASQHGKGLGKQLLSLGLEHLSERYPGQPQWIGVWSENHKALALYKARGFAVAGEYGFEVGGTIDREFILRKD